MPPASGTSKRMKMAVLGEVEGRGRFQEGAFAALIQRAEQSLGNSAATILKPEGLKYAAHHRLRSEVLV